MRGHESESKDRKGKGEGGRRMRSLKARQQNAPSVEETRAVETLAAFFRLVFPRHPLKTPTDSLYLLEGE